MKEFTGYDLIGDIHGHADELHALLRKLGYHGSSSDGFSQSERQVIFLGDFIDRGPKILEVLDTVRAMLCAGTAQAVMGNHEFNALAFHTPCAPVSKGSPQANLTMRPRSVKNIRQHAATIAQLKDFQLADALAWFRTLPMWLEISNAEGANCRAVHACWDDEQIQKIEKELRSSNGVTDQFMARATSKQSKLFKAVEIVLKGKEINLPDGHSFKDKEGHERTAIRARWFERPEADRTYQSYALQSDPIDCPIAIPATALDGITAYVPEQPPVFVGHYWLKAHRPQRLAPNVACLDYSVAKHGFLCAYRWDGESEIDNDKFVWTN